MYFMMCVFIGLGISFNITVSTSSELSRTLCPWILVYSSLKGNLDSSLASRFCPEVQTVKKSFIASVFEKHFNIRHAFLIFSAIDDMAKWKNCLDKVYYSSYAWYFIPAKKIFSKPSLPLSKNLLNMNCGQGNFK